MSLRLRWSLVAILLSVVPLAIVAALALAQFRAGLEMSEKSLENLAVLQVRAGIDGRLQEIGAVTLRIGRILGDGAIDNEEVRINLARDLMASDADIERMTVYSASDKSRITEIERGIQDKPVYLSPETLPAGADPNGGHWIDVAAATERPDLRYLAPVGKGESVTGYVLARVRPGALAELVEQVSRAAFGSTPNRIVVFDSAYRALAGGGDPASARQFIELVGVTPGGSETVLTRSELNLRGEKAVGTVATLKARGIIVVAMRPEIEAYPDYYAVRRTTLLVVGAMVVLALISAAVLARRTTAPILDLVTLTKQYAERRFAVRSPVRTGDELETLGGSLQAMADSLASSEGEILRRAQVEAGLARFLPAAVAAKIAQGEGKVDLGGQRRDITVLFADVCAFTTFSENASPERVVKFLNELFGLLSEIVFRHDGIVDKFLGDSVMAMFGATDDAADHAERAVACAEDMHRFVESMRPAWQIEYGFEVSLGIGLNTGIAVVGNLGSEKRMEFTAIGDTINVAARLEALARPGQTLATTSVQSATSDAFTFVSLGFQPLRGKAEKVEIFELEQS